MGNDAMQKPKIAYQKDGKVTILEQEYTLEDSIKPGYYKIHLEQMGLFATRALKCYDEPILPNSSMRITREYIDFDFIDQYFSKESTELHHDLGLKNKLGMMLHGSQGTGKSTIGQTVCKYMVENHGAVAFMLNSPDTQDISFIMEFITQVREKVGHFLSVIFVDESERLLAAEEDKMKNILDSDQSLTDNLFIFTTNYPEDIPETITDRPSRIHFDVEVEGINEHATIWEIVKSMNDSIKKDKQLEENVIRDLIPSLENQTVDQIKNKYLKLVFKHHISKMNLEKMAEKVEV